MIWVMLKQRWLNQTDNQYHVDKDGNLSSINVSETDEVVGDKKISIDTDLGNVTIHFEGE